MSKARWVVVGLGLLFAATAGAGRATQDDLATCPVDGKGITASAAARAVMVGDQEIRFCTGACFSAFTADPEKYLPATYQCPVFTNRRSKATRATRRVVNNNLYYLCCAACEEEFGRDPAPFLKSLKDPVTGMLFTPKPEGSSVRIGDQVYLFASDESRQAFEKDPDRYVARYR